MMNLNIQALEENNTWIMTHLPKENKAIDCKCVDKIKYNSDGSIERYKAWLDVDTH